MSHEEWANSYEEILEDELLFMATFYNKKNIKVSNVWDILTAASYYCGGSRETTCSSSSAKASCCGCTADTSSSSCSRESCG